MAARGGLTRLLRVLYGSVLPVAVLVLLAVGCTGPAGTSDPVPGPTASTSATDTPSPTPSPTPAPTPSSFGQKTFAPEPKDYDPPEPVVCPAATVRVSTASALRQAVTDARPGTSIEVAPGTYRVRLEAAAEGTRAEPVFLCGAGADRTTIDAGGPAEGPVLTFRGARWWRVVGLTLTNGRNGVRATATEQVVLQQLEITRAGEQAVWWRELSSDNLVRTTAISRTGLSDAGAGQGVVAGTSADRWCTPDRCDADESNRNVVVDSTFRSTTRAAVLAYEGTYSGVVHADTFDGSDLGSSSAWVEIRGSDWLVSGNTGRRAPGDGYRSRAAFQGHGLNNTFLANTGRELDRSDHGGRLISVRPAGSNRVSCDNRVSDGSAPRTNATCHG